MGEKELNAEVETQQILNRLGLTISQAKVYLALLKLERANAKTIADNSKVARQEVYRLLVELEKKSLVERIIAVPTKYSAVPIENGLSFLIEEKKKDLAELQNEVDKILPIIRSYLITIEDKRRTPQPEPTEFILIPERKALLLRMERTLENTEKSIDVIYPKEAFLRVLFNISDALNITRKRGVKVRCLLNDLLETNSLPTSVQNIVENPLFKIRTSELIPKENFWIFDEKEALLVTSPVRNRIQFPILWTTAEPLISLSENYFNTLWKKASFK